MLASPSDGLEHSSSSLKEIAVGDPYDRPLTETILGSLPDGMNVIAFEKVWKADMLMKGLDSRYRRFPSICSCFGGEVYKRVRYLPSNGPIRIVANVGSVDISTGDS